MVLVIDWSALHEIAPFERYGMAHWWVWLITLAVPVGLTLFVHRWPESRAGLQRGAAWFFAVLLVGNRFFAAYVSDKIGGVPSEEHLPLHICDLVCFALAGALIWRKAWLFQISYYWGMAGTLHGLLTPDLRAGFPHPMFFSFFVNHAGVVAGILTMIFLFGQRAAWRGAIVAWLALQAYVGVALVINLLLETNYGYLRAPPANPSLIDYLGPWPWYLLSLQVLAMASFLILYLPFHIFTSRTLPVEERRL
ncbi:MAG: TIGR02206 family membrane protein [Verrucomicrobiales bacterium]